MQNDEGTIFHSIIMMIFGLMMVTLVMTIVGSMLNSVPSSGVALSPQWNNTMQNMQSTTNAGFNVIAAGLVIGFPLVIGGAIIHLIRGSGSERQPAPVNRLNERFNSDPRLQEYGSSYGGSGVQGSVGAGGMPSPAYNSGYTATRLPSDLDISNRLQDKPINTIPDKKVVTNTTNRWETLDVVMESDFD